MNTYRLSADEFAVMESSFVSSGADFESSVSQTRLYQNTINHDFLQLFHCFHGTGSLLVFEWSCIAYQTQDSDLFLTDGYPRFGTYDDAVVMFVDAAATTRETALLTSEITFLGAVEALSMAAGGIVMLLMF